MTARQRAASQVIADALREAARVLAAVSETPRLDAELLMADALGISRSELLLRRMDANVPEGFAGHVERRLRHEPIAYITGFQEFFGLRFRVGPDVLIPRGDSELVVERALRARPDARTVLDCGTGSGALLLAVLHHLPAARGMGVDRCGRALALARQNAAQLGLADRATLLEADWDVPGWITPGGGPFDLILANPPYVETDAALPPSVRDHEPAGALFAGPQGLDAYRSLVPQLPDLLAPRGLVLLEIGAAQAGAVGALARASGLVAELHRDLADRPRVLELSRAN